MSLSQPPPPEAVMKAWNIKQPPQSSADAGLINHTYLIGSPVKGVLQWVNPIFDPAIHHDLHGITQHLKTKGLITPELIPTEKSELMLRLGEGSWRMWTYVPGRTIHAVESPEIAYEAGAMLAEFHRALADYTRPRVGNIRDIHNTPDRISNLEKALDECSNHPLFPKVEPLAQDILNAWAKLEWVDALPKRICHGDPKISNLHFHPTRNSAVCMLDLDTVGPQSIDAELGDAWRSWCNPVGESNPNETKFDMGLFKASLEGYASAAPTLSTDEKLSLPTGIMRICLELSSRFCADALQNNYFAENIIRYPIVGTHNLIRASSQYTLFLSIKKQHSKIVKLLIQQDF